MLFEDSVILSKINFRSNSQAKKRADNKEEIKQTCSNTKKTIYFKNDQQQTNYDQCFSSKPQNSNKCVKCVKLQKKIQQISKINAEVSIIKNKYQQFQEQIQFLLRNFSFIIELASDNIRKQVKKQVKQQFQQQKKFISNLNKKIQRLENQNQNLIQKIQVQKIIQQENKRLQSQNELLNSKILSMQRSSLNSSLRIPQPRKQFYSSTLIQPKFLKNDVGNEKSQNKKLFWSQQLRSNQAIQRRRIKENSLQKLKEKIKKFKKQLLMSKF